MSDKVAEIMYEDAQLAIFAAQPNEPQDVMFALATANIPFQVLLGSYKGTREVSYMIPMQFIQEVEALGYLTEQESILLVGSAQKDGRRQAWSLESGKEDPTVLGWLVAASHEEALKADGYSFNPLANSFFIINE